MKRIKNIVITLVAAVALVCAAVTAIACDSKVTTPPPTPVKLLLNYADVKTEYAYDEPFTYLGLKVQVELSDGAKQDVTTGYKIAPPDMTPGQHMVTVTYGSLTAKFPIYVEDVTKAYDDNDAFTVNGAGVYVAEADGIDLSKCVAVPLNADEKFIARTNAVFSSNRSYLKNFGAEGNCIGFSFAADKEYDGVTLAVSIGNPTEADIDLSENVVMYFGFDGADNMGELDLSGKTVKANSLQTLVFDDLTLTSYGNFIMEFTGDADITWDNVKVIVGADDVHVDSAVNIVADPVSLEAENMNTEKLVTENSVAQENGLKFGQPMLKDITGGKYVSDLKTGTKISTVINVTENSSLNFKLNANIPDGYDLNENWVFTLDTFTFNDVSTIVGEFVDCDLGTYPVKAGAHLFTAELVGATCDIDKFTFTPATFDGDAATLIADAPDKDSVVYGFGAYKIEAENLLDRSGWQPSGEYTVDDMVVGNYVTRIKGQSQFKTTVVLGKKAIIKITVKLSAWKHDTDAFEPWFISKATVDETSIAFKAARGSSFKDPSATGSVNGWGIAESGYVALEAGSHAITWTSGDVNYDWFEIYVFDPEEPLPEITVDGFGSNVMSADSLFAMKSFEKEWQDGGNAVKETTGKEFKAGFELKQRSAVKIIMRVSTWNSQTEAYNQSWLQNTKIGENTVKFTARSGSKFNGTWYAWGTVESNIVTLEAGAYDFSWKSTGIYAYRWLEIRAYDPDGPLPELSADEFKSYKIGATAMSTMAGCTAQWVGGDIGNAMTKANGKQFKFVFELKNKSAVKLSMKLSGWASSSETYNPSWMQNTKIGETAITFTTQDGSNFKGSGFAFGVAESNTVILEAGIYEFSWKSGDATYGWFGIDVSAPAE